MNEAEKDDNIKVVQDHLSQLMEHFDTVQIICTRHDGADDMTLKVALGGGNIYARIGSVEKWLDDMDKTLYDEDDDDESD